MNREVNSFTFLLHLFSSSLGFVCQAVGVAHNKWRLYRIEWIFYTKSIWINRFKHPPLAMLMHQLLKKEPLNCLRLDALIISVLLSFWLSTIECVVCVCVHCEFMMAFDGWRLVWRLCHLFCLVLCSYRRKEASYPSQLNETNRCRVVK